MNLFSWLNFCVFILLLGHIPKQNKLKAKAAAVANESSPCNKREQFFQNFGRGIYAVLHFHTLQRISQ